MKIAFFIILLVFACFCADLPAESVEILDGSNFVHLFDIPPSFDTRISLHPLTQIELIVMFTSFRCFSSRYSVLLSETQSIAPSPSSLPQGDFLCEDSGLLKWEAVERGEMQNENSDFDLLKALL